MIVTETNRPIHPRNVEIFHFNKYDAAVNRRFPDQEQVNTLLNIVKKGIPHTWKILDPVHANQAVLYRSPDDHPRWVGKIRNHVHKPDQLKTWLDAFKDNKEKSRIILAFQSLLNEIVLAPIIRQLLETEEAHEIVKKHGFDAISFAEPLIGIIQRSTGTKIMFYEWKGNPPSSETQGPIYSKFQFTNSPTGGLSLDLKKHFIKHGITPHDLATDQFIIEINPDGMKHVYLIDTEAYLRKIPNLMPKRSSTFPEVSQ